MKRTERTKLYVPRLALICILTSGMFLAGCVMVRVADPTENQISWDVDTAISLCLVEVIGKSVEALERIDYDTHCELEDCVNEKIQSKERVVLEYHGSEKGLVPRAK